MDYEDDLALVVRKLTAENLPLARELLSLPEKIRGYGPVKEAAYRQQMARRTDIRVALDRNGPMAIAAE